MRGARNIWIGRLALLATATALAACATRPLPPWQRTSDSRVPYAVAPVPAADSSPASLPADEVPTGPPAVLAPNTASDVVTASPESAAVAARFPDPPVSYLTPAFEAGRTAGYTTNAELRAVLHGLARDGTGSANPTSIRLVQLGSSQGGVPIEALHFSRAPAALGSPAGARPTVLLVGQQHGDEPAGAEALLVIASELAKEAAEVLDRIDVVILPRANPDGAAAEKRLSASGIDINRDHLLLRTPEAQAQAALVREFQPLVVLDLHEYSVLGRWVEKFGAVQRFDALVQYAMVANMPAFVSRASEEWFREPLLQTLGAQGLTTEWYYTTSVDASDKKVSMGGVQPDTGRNVNGLRNAISFLIETRGIGLGRAHLLRRVHTHVSAVASVLKSTAARADALKKLRRFVDGEVAAQACKGETVVEAGPTTSEYRLVMLDPQTGADKALTVEWDSALALTPLKRRARPCGYWLAADQLDAVLRLRALGVQVQRLEQDGELRGEFYIESAREVGARDDVRGSVADAGAIARVKVQLSRALIEVQPGGYYVGLDQPLANIVIAALEPDTQNGFVAHRVIANVDGVARVLAKPAARMSAVP